VLWARRDVIGARVDDFLAAERAPLNPPGEMKGLPAAVELVIDALQRGERIAIFGDYDADGVTATAVLHRGLTRLGADVLTYIPHRLRDGYGLSDGGLAELWEKGARLVIVDTLARIRTRNTGRNIGLYDDDYHAVALLKRLADNAGASLLVIHHLRKMSSDDPLEALSGTMGLSGAAGLNPCAEEGTDQAGRNSLYDRERH